MDLLISNPFATPAMQLMYHLVGAYGILDWVRVKRVRNVHTNIPCGLQQMWKLQKENKINLFWLFCVDATNALIGCIYLMFSNYLCTLNRSSVHQVSRKHSSDFLDTVSRKLSRTPCPKNCPRHRVQKTVQDTVSKKLSKTPCPKNCYSWTSHSYRLIPRPVNNLRMVIQPQDMIY